MRKCDVCGWGWEVFQREYSILAYDGGRQGGIGCNVRKGYCRLLYKNKIIFVLLCLYLYPEDAFKYGDYFSLMNLCLSHTFN